MHPQLSRFPSLQFYEGKLQNGPDMLIKCSAPWHTNQARSWQSDPQKLGDFYPIYAFFNVGAGVEAGKRITGGGSLYNMDEVHAIVTVLTRFFQDNPGVSAESVGIITPYREQKYRLERELADQRSETLASIDVRTVDGFQGQEKEIILFSCVRSNREKSIGFLSDGMRFHYQSDY
jgi:senataxin